jgi:hypothetical protein
MPSMATRVPVRLAGQDPQAPPCEHHLDHDLLLAASHQLQAVGFRRQVGFVQTEITTISGSTSFCSMPSMATRVPVRLAGELP